MLDVGSELSEIIIRSMENLLTKRVVRMSKKKKKRSIASIVDIPECGPGLRETKFFNV